MHKNLLSVVFKHPLMSLATPVARGGVCTILNAWYEAGCPELGDNPDYATIGRMRLNDYQNHKKIILQILGDIMPPIRVHWEKNIKILQDRRRFLETGRAAIAREKALKREKKAALLDKEDTGRVVISPIKPEPRSFNEGFSDTYERQRIIKAKKKSTDFGLTDS